MPNFDILFFVRSLAFQYKIFYNVSCLKGVSLRSQPLQTSYSYHVPQVCHPSNRTLVLFQEAQILLSCVPEAANTRKSRTPYNNSCMQPSSDQVHGLNNFETSSCTIFQ